MPRKVLVLGAASAIAQETAKRLAGDGDSLFLVDRDAGRLEVVAGDLQIRCGREVGRLAVDLDDYEAHATVLAEASRTLDGLDTVFLAYGILGDQEQCQASWAETERVLRTNLLSALSLLTLVAQGFETQGAGTIVVISSVAGDRGRQSNYVYGAAKGALSIFLQGLRNRLHGRNVRVLTIKPGLVDTPMTAHLDKGLLFVGPETIARGIHNALRRGRDVAYVPWFWRIIMGVICLIPEAVFKRMRL